MALTTLLATMAVGCPSQSSTVTTEATTSYDWRHNESTTTTQPYEPFTPEWLQRLEIPPDSYWDEVAVCETRSNWQDRGNFAGGLGIAYTTWTGFGGEEFGDYQWQATRKEQITVANRIALHGYMNSRGQFTEPVGFNGWGCIRNNKYLTPPVGSPWQQAKEQS
jgi:hypothetical protein